MNHSSRSFHHPHRSCLSNSYIPYCIIMTLDIDAFRPEKGGDPEKVRENQRKRFADPNMVDKVVESDELWRKGGKLIMRIQT